MAIDYYRIQCFGLRLSITPRVFAKISDWRRRQEFVLHSSVLKENRKLSKKVGHCIICWTRLVRIIVCEDGTVLPSQLGVMGQLRKGKINVDDETRNYLLSNYSEGSWHNTHKKENFPSLVKQR